MSFILQDFGFSLKKNMIFTCLPSNHPILNSNRENWLTAKFYNKIENTRHQRWITNNWWLHNWCHNPNKTKTHIDLSNFNWASNANLTLYNFLILTNTSWAALVSNSLFGWNLPRLYQILLLKRYQIFLSNWIRKVWANFWHNDYI